MALAAGTRLGPYEIVSSLGAGGMGEVYRARDPRLGRDVAIKVIGGEGPPAPERLRRFEQEARSVAALQHPHILAVHDVGTHDGRPYVVFELLDGETLRERLSRGALPVRKAVEVAVQICDGLAAAHAHGVVHRDLKPENVFLVRESGVKLLDFGLAKLLEAAEEGGSEAATATATDRGTWVGTPGYVSPEQLRGQGATARSDVFALGAVLYEMLTGQRAFKGATKADTLAAILEKDPPAMALPGGAVPAPLERVVLRCLEKDPDDRFQSTRDVAFALEALSTGSMNEPGTVLPAAKSR
jgi:serine/threonine protein kinase